MMGQNITSNFLLLEHLLWLTKFINHKIDVKELFTWQKSKLENRNHVANVLQSAFSSKNKYFNQTKGWDRE